MHYLSIIATARISILLLLPIIQTALFASGLAFQGAYFFIVAGGFVLSDSLIALFFNKTIKRSRILWYSLPSLLLYTSAAASLVVAEERYLIIAIIAAHIVFQWLYLINLYYFLHKSERYQEHSFWHISTSLHVISFFLTAIAAYGLVSYADYSIFVVVVPVCMISAATFAQQLVIANMDAIKQWRFWSLQTLIIAECMLVIHWLPSMYLPKAFLLTIPFFLSCQLGLPIIRKDQTDKSHMITILVAASMLLLVVLTTRWR